MWAPETSFEIEVMKHENVAQAILNTARSFDLIVLRSLRYRTAGGLEVSDITTQLVQHLTCSVVLLGEPQRTTTGVLLPKPSPRVANDNVLT